jgi:transposase InsO family protein
MHVLTSIFCLISGFRYVLTVIDTFSKRRWIVGLPDKSAASVRAAFEAIFAQLPTVNGNTLYPEEVQSDNGGEFVNALMEQFFAQCGIKWIRSSPRNPQANGMVRLICFFFMSAKSYN